jgi:hypothetical protein
MSEVKEKTHTVKIVRKRIKIKKSKKKIKKVKTMDEFKNEYINSMNEKEQIAYKIAKEHLGSSFNLEKSIGFQKWLKKNSNNI